MPVVSHRLQKPGGAALANAVVHVRLVASSTGEGEGFVASTQSGILAEHKLLTDSTGLWSLTLTANSLITPTGTTYQVIQPATNGAVVTEHFIVPNGAGPYWLGDILASPPAGLPGSALTAHEAAADPHPVYLTASEGDAAYVTQTTAQLITGLKTISPSAASAVGLIVRGLASQTGDLQQWQRSAGTVLARVSQLPSDRGGQISACLSNGTAVTTLEGGDNAGNALGALGAFSTMMLRNLNSSATELTIMSRSASYGGHPVRVQTYSSQTWSFVSNAGDGQIKFSDIATGADHVVISPGGASRVQMLVKGAASQTGDLTQWQNSAGTVLVNVMANGTVETEAVRGRTNATTGSQLIFTGGTAYFQGQTTTYPSFAVRAMASQTAALQRWESDTQDVLASISAAGRFAATFAEGFRTLELGAADSAGVGFRAVRVPN